MKNLSQITRVVLFLLCSFITLRVHAAEAVQCLDYKSINAAIADAEFAVACANAQSLSDAEAAYVLHESARKCVNGAHDGGWAGIYAAGADAVSLLPGLDLTKHIKALIHDLQEKHEDPVTNVAATAEVSVENQMPLLDRIREVPERMQDYWLSVAAEVREKWKMFWCLPVSDRTEAICQASAKAIYETLLLGTAIRDAGAALKMGKVAKDFVTEVRIAKGSAISPTESLQFATEAMRATAKGQTLQKIGNASLVEYVDPVSKAKYLKLEEQVAGADGKMYNAAREVPIDAKTGAIDANSEMGRAVLQKTAQQGANGEPLSVIFGDINHLHVTNYYKGGMATGDAYIKSVTSEMKAASGDKALLFKVAGDEFAVFVKSSDPKVVRAVVEKISDGVAKNPEAKAIFKNRLIEKVEDYRVVRNASSIDQLPISVADKLSIEQRTLAQTDFAGFKKSYLDKQIDEVTGQARYRPTVSIGSAVIGKNDTLATALERAELQESRHKMEYKKDAGFSLEKYGGTSIPTNKPNFNARPQIEDPALPPDNP